MPNCAIATCNNYTRNTTGKEINYFRFPIKDNERCKKWINACKRQDKINLKHACICSAHFTPDCFAEPSFKEKFLNYTSTKRSLKVDVIPTLNLPGNKRATERCNRMTKRQKSSESTDNLKSIGDECTGVSPAEVLESSKVDLIERNEHGAIFQLKQQVQKFLKDILKLQKKLTDSEEKIKYMEIMVGKLFTPGQVKHLFNPKQKRVRWSSEDIASAISLRRVSPKAYQYLKSNGYPLPALCTLQQWGPHFQ